jgi:anthranilate phosphoribosyltransferase
MDINELAKQMRERALLIEGDEQLDETSLRDFSEIKVAREQKLKRIEDIKKLHFNAGRWVGGAKDWTARKAFEQVQAQESA